MKLSSKIWKYLGTKSGITSWLYFASFVIFIIVLPYYWLGFENKILGLVNNERIFDSNEFIKFLPKSISKIKEFVPLSVIGFSAILLIFFNTLLYFIEYLSELGSNLIKGGTNLLLSITFALWFVISLYFLIPIVTIIYDIPNDLHIKLLENSISSTSSVENIKVFDEVFAEYLKNSFKDLVHLIEFYVMAVVASFILIDWATLHMRKSTNAHSRELVFIKNQIFLIDLPVLIGSVIIYAFAMYLENNILTLINPQAKNIKVDTDAPQVFSLGALAMHLIFSQTIFIILNIRDSYNDYWERVEREKNEKKSS